MDSVTFPPAFSKPVLKASVEFFARRKIGVGERRGLAANLAEGIGAHRVAVVPHAEREPRDIRRQIGDPRGTRIGDDHWYFRLRHHGCKCDRGRREHKAGQDLHLVIGDKLRRNRFCLRASRRALVALDDLDFVRLDILGVKFHVKIESLVDLVAQVSIGAAERENHSDFDGLGLGRSAHGKSHGGHSEPPY